MSLVLEAVQAIQVCGVSWYAVEAASGLIAACFGLSNTLPSGFCRFQALAAPDPANNGAGLQWQASSNTLRAFATLQDLIAMFKFLPLFGGVDCHSPGAKRFVGSRSHGGCLQKARQGSCATLTARIKNGFSEGPTN